MGGQRDQDPNRWDRNQRNDDERRPWEGYRSRSQQQSDYGSAGGQYSSRVGPDQDPYSADEGAYFGAGRGYREDPEHDPGARRSPEAGRWEGWDERSGRGRAGYGQVGGRRETARDEGGYSRGSRQGGRHHYGQGGYGEEQEWGRDRGQYGQPGWGQGNPPDTGQLAYGPNAQNYGQQVSPGYGPRGRSYGTDGIEAGQGRQDIHHDPEYREWRREQARKYDEDYDAWRETQLKGHDEDYDRWRRERQDKFGESFSEWRDKRQTPDLSAGDREDKKAH